MPKLSEIIKVLDSCVPFALQEEWDNSGLMVGDLNCDILKVLVALDCTEAVIEEAVQKGANLIVTHHPLIFNKIKSVDCSDSTGRKINKLIKNDINVVSLHTNFDKIEGGTSDTVCRLLKLNNLKNLTDDAFSLGKVGEISPLSLTDFVGYVKEKLNLKAVKYVGNDSKTVKKVAVVSGAGSEFYADAIKKCADVLVTSEVKEHIGIECLEKGIAIIDAGHFETEAPAMITMKKILNKVIDEVYISEAYTELFKYI